MKIATQPSPELMHVAKLIEDIPIAMLTTVQDDEAISSRPMAVLEMDAQGALWFLASTIAGKPIAMGEHGSHTGLSSSTPTAS